VGQVAANPADGIATLADAVPGLLSADWAAVLAVPADWAHAGDSAPSLVYASWRAPQDVRVPDVTPLRSRAFDGRDGERYAAAPFGRAGLVLLAARGSDTGAEAGLPPPAFHVTEVDRLAQLVRASALVLGSRLEAPSGRSPTWPVNSGRFAAVEH